MIGSDLADEVASLNVRLRSKDDEILNLGRAVANAVSYSEMLAAGSSALDLELKSQRRKSAAELAETRAEAWKAIEDRDAIIGSLKEERTAILSEVESLRAENERLTRSLARKRR